MDIRSRPWARTTKETSDRCTQCTAASAVHCLAHSESNQRARTNVQRNQPLQKLQAPFSAQPVSSLGAPLVGARMPPYGMPSVTGMHRAHVVSVVRPIDRVWVRTPLLTGCVCSKRRCHDVTCCQRKVCREGGDAAPRVRCDRFTSYTTHIHRHGRSTGTARRGRAESQVNNPVRTMCATSQPHLSYSRRL